MSEAVRLRELLLDVVARVKRRGASTKVNWMNFSNGRPVSRSQFEKMLSTYGLPFRPDDIDIIWANIGAKGGSMNYPDFVRFLSLDGIDSSIVKSHGVVQSTQQRYLQSEHEVNPTTIVGTKSSVSSLSLPHLISKHFPQIVNDLLTIDRQLTGFISVSDFELMIQAIDLVNSNEIQCFVSSYDPRNCGTFNYFNMLGDMCNQRTNSTNRTQLETMNRQSYVQQPRQQSFVEHTSIPDQFLQPKEQVPQRSGCSVNEIIQTIATRMTTNFDSSARCFNKWRGHASSIDAQQFADCANRDFKINMTVDDARDVIRRFSTTGTFTLGTFLKMIGAGADSASRQMETIITKELDEEEKTLQHLARQARGKDWETIFERISDVDQIGPALKKIETYVLSPELKACSVKYGKDGVVDRIHNFIASF
jgi:hypothetical protein